MMAMISSDHQKLLLVLVSIVVLVSVLMSPLESSSSPSRSLEGVSIISAHEFVESPPEVTLDTLSKNLGLTSELLYSMSPRTRT